MAHQTTIVENGMTYNVTEFDHTAQEIDDAVSNLGGASTPQGAIAALGAMSRYNLLDNWYFYDPINQRGATSYQSDTTSYNSIDRWKVYRIDQSLEGGYLKITVPYGGNGNFRQHVDPQIADWLIGKTVTLSFLANIVNNPESVSLSWCDQSGSNTQILRLYSGQTSPGIAIYSVTFTVPNDFSGVSFYLFTSSAQNVPEVHLYAAKLEVGAHQTLAIQDNSSLKLLDSPPNKTIELLKCQRYQLIFRALGQTSEVPVFSGYISNSQKNAYFSVCFPVKMRVNPTVTIDDLSVTIRTVSGYATFATYESPANIDYANARFSSDIQTASCYLVFDDNLGTNNSPCVVSLRSGMLIFDANL